MAKFYERYMPVPGDKSIFYGYRDNNYIINGQGYDNTTNLEQVGNFQCNCTYASPCVGIVHSQCVFEPTAVGGSNYDINGNRFSGDYTFCCHVAYGERRNPWGSCAWSFKSHFPYCFRSFYCTVSNTTPCCAGFPANSGVRDEYSCQGTPCLPCVSQTLYCTYFAPCGNFNLVEEPAGKLNCFVPYTWDAYCMYNNNSCGCTSGTGLCEFTYGDTTVCYLPDPGTCFCYAGASNWGAGGGPAYFAVNSVACGGSLLASGLTGLHAFTTSNTADSGFFGSCCTYCYVNTGAGQANWGHNVVGSSPISNGVNQSEGGLRTFITASNTLVFYHYYNAQFGGIHGTDTSTSTNVRLSLKMYTNANGYTTTLATYKKIGGVIIPSQNDSTDPNVYRYHMINFNGADTRSLTILKPNININTGALTTNTYNLAMTAAEQQAVYNMLGHNATANSVYPNSTFRRETVHRIWYSIDASNNKRLHLGTYNTGGSGLVTALNGFSSNTGAGSMFNIHSWLLTDANTTASYLGYTNFASSGLRYFCPLDAPNWTTIYAGNHFLSGDSIITLNQSTGLYQLQSQMPYVAARLFTDKDGRWMTQVLDPNPGFINTSYYNYLDVLSTSVGSTLVVTANTTQYTFTGTPINGNVVVNVFNYAGTRLAKNVALSIIGPTSTPGVTFADGTYSNNIVTSTSNDTIVGIRVISSSGAKIIGTVSA